MRLREFEALQPMSLEETTSLLRKYKNSAVLKAGGTSLVPEMGLGLKRPEHVITLSSVEGMDAIEEGSDGLHMGAMASLYQVKTSPLVKRHLPALARAVEEVSAPVMHYQSTIGGNLCQNTRCQFYNQSEFWRGTVQPCFKRGGGACLAAPGAKRCGSVYQGDLAAILICMDAKMRIHSPRKERVEELERLYTGKGEFPLRLRPNELVSELIIPPPPNNRRFGYEKLRERGSLDYPALGIAAMMELDGTLCKDHRFVITAAGPKPLVISDPSLNGKVVDQGCIESAARLVHRKFRPIANIPLTPQYRRSMSKVLVERVLGHILKGVTE
jgi:4-hydroxybenzoyl-CoA reductase beta subunit